MLDITPVKKKHLSLYLYKTTVTVIMLHTIYISAKQALEQSPLQHPNTMVLLMSGKKKIAIYPPAKT